MINLANIASLEQWDVLLKHNENGEGNLEDRADIVHDSWGMGYTPLLYAAYFNEPEIFSLLVQRGANVHAVDLGNKSALHIAAKYGSATVVRQLLLEGVDPAYGYIVHGRKILPADVTNPALRGPMAIEGSKALTDADLREVDLVFRNWPRIKEVYNAKGLDGISALACLNDDLGNDAKKYIAIEDIWKKKSVARAKTAESKRGESAKRAPSAARGKSPAGRRTSENVVSNLKGLSLQAQQTPDIFISYCWVDKDLVRPLADQFKTNGYCVWIDVGQMGGGDKLYEAIDAAIRACKVVVSFVSIQYAQSLNCRREVSLSSAVRKPIIPVVVSEESKKSWPPIGPMGFLLTESMYIDLTKNVNENSKQLLEAISRHTASV